MLDLARGYFRKSVFKTYRYLKHPRRLKDNAMLRWFSSHFLNKRVWKPTRHTFAGGMAVGFFVTVQLFPGQMPLAVILAAAFRVNIPIALAVCWLSNPATFVPIGMVEKEIGEWLLGIFGDPTAAWFATVENASFAKGLRYAQFMYVGGLVGGLVLAPVSYMITYALWALASKLSPSRDQSVSSKTTPKETPAP